MNDEREHLTNGDSCWCAPVIVGTVVKHNT